MAAGGSPPRRGWFYDKPNARLAARFNNTSFMLGTASAVTFPLATTFTLGATFSSTVSSASTVTATSGTAITAGGAAGFLATSTAGFGIYFGSGAPTVSAAKGSLYLRSDGTGTGDRAYICTGTTNWTALTTAA
jgi:hypothetical protein